MAEGILASIGTVGDALDNALAESTIGLYKAELINRRGPWRALAHVETATAGYLHWFNTERLHGAIGDIRRPSTRPPGTPRPGTRRRTMRRRHEPPLSSWMLPRGGPGGRREGTGPPPPASRACGRCAAACGRP